MLWQKWRFWNQYIVFYNKHHILERIQSSVLRWSFLASFWAPLNSTWMVQGCVYVIHDQKSAQPVLMAYAWSIWCTNLLIAETYIYILKNDLFFEPVINIHIFSRDGIWFSCFVKSCSIWKIPKFKVLKMFWSNWKIKSIVERVNKMQGENWFDQDRYDCLNGGL